MDVDGYPAQDRFLDSFLEDWAFKIRYLSFGSNFSNSHYSNIVYAGECLLSINIELSKSKASLERRIV